MDDKRMMASSVAMTTALSRLIGGTGSKVMDQKAREQSRPNASAHGQGTLEFRGSEEP